MRFDEVWLKQQFRPEYRDTFIWDLLSDKQEKKVKISYETAYVQYHSYDWQLLVEQGWTTQYVTNGMAHMVFQKQK